MEILYCCTTIPAGNEGTLDMDKCPKQSSWFSYFSENMDDMGLEVPTSWFGKGAKVTGYIAALVAVAEKFGPRVTVTDVVVAGSKGEQLVVVGAGYASWYLGAAVGSAAVATGRYVACGTQIGDVFAYAARNQMLTPTVTRQLLRHPEIYDDARKNRRAYARLARTPV